MQLHFIHFATKSFTSTHLSVFAYIERNQKMYKVHNCEDMHYINSRLKQKQM